ncbi:MAG TPA: hypothetical protein P5318_06300 [Candidatus Hydrogenedentes bacterium]|nr:hypothetical protein [Candidatus Hydrogenedentota bacterium]HRT19722.1 hypothetical protein [Candidatus Hydrogenedentota bacterium]HRT64496.1 hypothetical protein [Candidatus Hydrogenedentota bacterium]
MVLLSLHTPPLQQIRTQIPFGLCEVYQPPWRLSSLFRASRIALFLFLLSGRFVRRYTTRWGITAKMALEIVCDKVINETGFLGYGRGHEGYKVEGGDKMIDSERVNKFDTTACNAEFRFGTDIDGSAESEFGVTLSMARINSQTLSEGCLMRSTRGGAAIWTKAADNI